MVSYFALVISSYSICVRFNITTKQTPTQTEVLSSNLIRFIVARVQAFSTPQPLLMGILLKGVGIGNVYTRRFEVT